MRLSLRHAAPPPALPTYLVPFLIVDAISEIQRKNHSTTSAGTDAGSPLGRRRSVHASRRSAPKHDKLSHQSSYWTPSLPSTPFQTTLRYTTPIFVAKIPIKEESHVCFRDKFDPRHIYSALHDGLRHFVSSKHLIHCLSYKL